MKIGDKTVKKIVVFDKEDRFELDFVFEDDTESNHYFLKGDYTDLEALFKSLKIGVVK